MKIQLEAWTRQEAFVSMLVFVRFGIRISTKQYSAEAKWQYFSCACLKSASAHAQYNTKAVVTPLTSIHLLPNTDQVSVKVLP